MRCLCGFQMPGRGTVLFVGPCCMAKARHPSRTAPLYFKSVVLKGAAAVQNQAIFPVSHRVYDTYAW